MPVNELFEKLVALGLVEILPENFGSIQYFVSPLVGELVENELDSGERFRALDAGASGLFEVWSEDRRYRDWQQTWEVRRLALECWHNRAIIADHSEFV